LVIINEIEKETTVCPYLLLLNVKPQWIETIDGWIPGSLVNIISIKSKNYYISKEFLFNIKVKSV